MHFISVSCLEHDRLQFFDNLKDAHRYAQQLVDLYGAGAPDMIEFKSEESMREFWSWYDDESCY